MKADRHSFLGGYVRRRIERASEHAMPPLRYCLRRDLDQALGSVIREDFTAAGECVGNDAALGERAGLPAGTVEMLLDAMKRERLITVSRRPTPGKTRSTRSITITAPEWIAWIAATTKP